MTILILSLVSGFALTLLFGIAIVKICRCLRVDKQFGVPDEEPPDQSETSEEPSDQSETSTHGLLQPSSSKNRNHVSPTVLSSILSNYFGYSCSTETAAFETINPASVACNNFEDTLESQGVELRVLPSNEESDSEVVARGATEPPWELWQKSHIMLLVLDSNLRILVWSSGMTKVGSRVFP